MSRCQTLRRTAAIGAVCAIAGCGVVDEFESFEAIRTPLIEGFESYMLPDEAWSALPSGRRWREVERSSLATDDPRPRFDWLVVSVETFRHLGEDGELVLTFFNDRLMGTVFYADKPQAYVRALRGEGIVPEGGVATIRPFTVVRFRADLSHRPSVSWIDSRLEEQHDRWVSTYS